MLNFKTLVLPLVAFSLGPVWVSSEPTTLNSQAVATPEDDPFYQAPADLKSYAPGAILNQRTVVTSFFGLVPDPVEAWQLLYRTNAINGTAIASATTIFKPLSPKRDRFVSFHTAYDGAARNGKCDPSYNYRLGAPQYDLISSIEFPLLQAFLIEGYIVSSPDYEGPDAAWIAGRLAGTGVLDSMRAVANFKNTLGLTSNPAIVGYGYSGGAIATGWAAGLQPSYAPELNIKGWAQGGTPANLTGTAIYMDGGPFSGFLPQALLGVSSPSAYGATFGSKLKSIITPFGQSHLDFAANNCGIENVLNFPMQSIFSPKFQTEGDRFPYDPVFPAAFQTMGVNRNETPTAPVYLFHAPADEIAPYANTSTLYHDWCEFGASIDFVTYANGEHATTEVLGFPGALKFVQNAFAGTVSTGCSQQMKLDVGLDPLVLGASLEPILLQLIAALGIAGEGDSNIKANLSSLARTVS